jgi:hypothetical protein
MVKAYPEMDIKIKDILRVSNDPIHENPELLKEDRK